MIGQRLSHYGILEKLGEGGMGTVYKALDTDLDRLVALKFLHASGDVPRLLREAKTAASLNHPNICAVHEVNLEHGFIAMELVEGQSLAARIAGRPLPVPEALDLAIQICEGLSAAHEKGIIHRDIKSANILVTQDGRAKILDFGLARVAGQTMATGEGSVAGTPGYMAPEQMRGEPGDRRTDIWASGAVLHEMLTGRLPHGRTGTLPEGLGRIVRKALAEDPSHRYQHIEDLLVDLRAAAPARPAVRRTSRRRLIAGAALAVLAAGGVLLWQRMHAAPLTDKDTLVLADFTNTTGDSVFDDTLKQGLSVQLEQSPFLNLVSDQRVNGTLKLMGRAAGDRLTPEVAREVCQRTGSKAMLAGSIAALGSQFVIGLKAVDCHTGNVLAAAQEQAASKEAVLKALDAAAVRLRRKLGESLSSVQKYATPLEEVTTPSLEALKAFSLGRETLLAKGFTAARPFFQRAMDLDPNFALAYAAMGANYFDLSEGGRGAEFLRKAYDLRGKVSERERFMIEGAYYFYSTRELEKAAQTFELFQETYPRDGLAYTSAGVVAWALGNWEEALENFQEARRLDPNNANSHSTLGFAYTVRNRLNEAEAVCKQAEDRKLESEGLLLVRYYLAFLKGDGAQMTQLASAAMGRPGAEDLMLATQADTEGWHGKLKNAHELTGRAMDSAQHRGAKEAAAAYQAAAALRDVESGNREQAQAEANAALKLGPNREVRVMAALALARAGDAAGAEKLAAELEKTFPLDTLVQRYWLPAIRAAAALERQDAKRAIDLLKPARMIELSGLTGDLAVFMCPPYVRGAAYLMLHDGGAAAAEFQKLIDHRGLVVNFPWGALARLHLARAHVLQGDTAKARAAYQDFLGLWKDADQDVPVLKQAQQEHARLR
jgi:tetratricopeptide (TPR) repeat protein/predicted Ser/Thr protein kinase